MHTKIRLCGLRRNGRSFCPFLRTSKLSPFNFLPPNYGGIGQVNEAIELRLTATMRLEKLPNEIKHSVAKSLSDADLNALSRVSTHFCDRLRLDLFKRNVGQSSSTALFWAARHDVPGAVALMLAAGADVNKTLSMPEQDEFHTQLVAYGVDSEPSTYIGGSPLHVAAAHASLSTLQLLLDNDANIEQKDRTGRTPLLRCDATNLSVLKLFYDRGANFHATINQVAFGFKVGILEFVVKHGTEQTMEFVLEKQAPIRADELTQRPLMSIAINNGNVATATVLVKHGVSATDCSWFPGSQPPLILALEKRDEAMMRFLLSNGVEMSQRNIFGQSAFYYAVVRKYVDVIPTLINLGADVNETDDNGISILMTACTSSTIRMIRCLLDTGAFPDSRDMFGRTVAHVASAMGRLDVVRELLQAGADADARDDEGLTIMESAKGSQRDDIVEMLQDFKAGILLTPTREELLDLEPPAEVTLLLLEDSSFRMSNAISSWRSGMASLANMQRQ